MYKSPGKKSFWKKNLEIKILDKKSEYSQVLGKKVTGLFFAGYPSREILFQLNYGVGSVELAKCNLVCQNSRLFVCHCSRALFVNIAGCRGVFKAVFVSVNIAKCLSFNVSVCLSVNKTWYLYV